MSERTRTIVRPLRDDRDHDAIRAISEPEPQLAQGQPIAGLVAERDGQLTGYIELRSVLFLESLINPTRSPIVATRLFDHSVFVARQVGAPEVLAAIEPDKHQVIRNLQKAGFELVSDYRILRLRLRARGDDNDERQSK